MKLALLAVLLAFAAPAPVAESAFCIEEESVLESGRGSKSSHLRAPHRKVRRLEQVRPSLLSSGRDLDAASAPRDPSWWPPPVLSRPPPLG